MKVIGMLKKGLNQLQRKKKIRSLKIELGEKREELSLLFLKIGTNISEVNLEEFADFEELNSMHNVLSIIEKLENENLELEEKIDITKDDYNKHIDAYIPLIAELKENLSTPQNKLLSFKEKLIGLKVDLKILKDSLKEKENIFKDTQDRLDNKSEEDELDDEKISILENDYKRLQKELLEITQDFENLTEDYNSSKEKIKIIEEEIKTAEEQISTYKKEMGRLKKEKVRELDAIKKIVSNNKNSIESRNKELEGIYRNIGDLSFSKKVLPEQFKELYSNVENINIEIEKITSDRQMVMLEADKAERFILFKFFTTILVIIAILVIITWGVYSLSSGNGNKNTSINKDIATDITINNTSCNRGEILMKIPKSQHPPFSVKSNKLFTNLNKENDTLKVVFSADKDDTVNEYDLKIFSSGKEFTSYTIESKKDEAGCLKFNIKN